MIPITDLMTVREVAETLRLTEKTIRRMVDREELPCVRIGNRIRFLRKDIEEMIYQNYRKV